MSWLHATEMASSSKIFLYMTVQFWALSSFINPIFCLLGMCAQIKFAKLKSNTNITHKENTQIYFSKPNKIFKFSFYLLEGFEKSSPFFESTPKITSLYTNFIEIGCQHVIITIALATKISCWWIWDQNSNALLFESKINFPHKLDSLVKIWIDHFSNEKSKGVVVGVGLLKSGWTKNNIHSAKICNPSKKTNWKQSCTSLIMARFVVFLL